MKNINNPGVIENSEIIYKALASETRKEILKRLCDKPSRPVDLSKELEKDRSTIIEHLKTLSQAGLVERMEREGHKWIFYRLSSAGQLLFPNKKKRVLYIAIATLALIGAFLSMFAYVQQPIGVESAAGQYLQKALTVQESRVSVGTQSEDIYLYATGILLMLFAAAALQAIIKRDNELVIPKAKN